MLVVVLGHHTVARCDRITRELLILLANMRCCAAYLYIGTIAVIRAITGILGLPPTSSRTLGVVIVLPLPDMIHVLATAVH